MDPEALLVGPRGRRLCLEFVAHMARRRETADGQEYLHAAFSAADELDPGRGTSRVTLRMRTKRQAEPDKPSSSPSPEEVARLLDQVRLDPTEDDVVDAALAVTVDSARYWQEPDGEDALAAAPAMRAALRRVAVAITSAETAAWWSTPVDRAGQWSVGFPPPAQQETRGTPRDLLAQWRANTVGEELRARRERPADVHASWSGAWWSSPTHTLLQTTRALGDRGPVGLRLVEDSFGWEHATAVPVTVPDDARVFEVDGPDAWAELCRRFPLEVTASRRHDWYRATGVDGAWVIPDWSRVAETYDGVHVSVAGHLTTAGRAVPVDDARTTVLAGWDPDQTSWLTDAVRADDDGPGRQAWVRRDDGGGDVSAVWLAR